MVNGQTFEFKQTPTAPLFFISHGGPSFIDKNDPTCNAGAWETTRRIGTYIKKTVKPKFIIVVSAHWRSSAEDEILVTFPGPGEDKFIKANRKSNKIDEVNENALIYDFNSDPNKYPNLQFHTFSNKAIVSDIIETLKETGWKNVRQQERGLDHGTFIPLKVAFAEDVKLPDSKKWDIDVPLIQISQIGTDDIDLHFKVGQALAKYRQMGAVLLFSGMSVHNLANKSIVAKADYPNNFVETFNRKLTNILVHAKKKDTLSCLEEFNTSPTLISLYQMSHPTKEHFMPLVIAAGASNNDQCKELFTDSGTYLGWNIYGWGNLTGY